MERPFFPDHENLVSQTDRCVHDTKVFTQTDSDEYEYDLYHQPDDRVDGEFVFDEESWRIALSDYAQYLSS